MEQQRYELLPALSRMPGHLLWRARARKHAVLGDDRPGGVDLQGVAALHALDDGRVLSQQDLARATGVSRTTIAATVRALAAAGLVERVRNPEDRRAFSLSRTSAGDEVVRDWVSRASSQEAELSAGLTAAECDELAGLLRAVVGDELADDVLPELQRSVSFLVGRAHTALHRDFGGALEPLGVEPRLFGALNILAATGPITQSELSRWTGVSGPTVVQMVDDLERRGLLERRRSPQDRRAHLLHLLPEADGVLAAARRVAAEQDARRFGALTPAEHERLLALLAAYVTA